jgi:hypothetical protein
VRKNQSKFQLNVAFCFVDPLKRREGDFLTEAGAYPQLPTQPIFSYYFQTNSAIFLDF